MSLFCSTHGAENGTRTRDPNLGKVVLYQLSYFRIFFQKFNVLKGISLNASAKVMLFFELTNFSAFFFQKNSPFAHFSSPLPPYTLLIYKIKRDGISNPCGRGNLRK